MSQPADTYEGALQHEGPEGFAQVPAWVIRRCRTDVWLYAYLRAEYGGFSATFPGIQRIADDFGIGRSTVQRSIRGLIDAGALDVEVRIRPDGGQSTNRYTTRWVTPEDRRRQA